MTGPGTYRHKPTIIHAMQFTARNALALEAWLDTELGENQFDFGIGNTHLTIETPEGDRDVPADAGYWIVEGVAGEFYPVHPDVFARVYEPAGGEF